MTIGFHAAIKEKAGERKVALLLSVLEQGLIYAIMGLGVYITYKILDFPHALRYNQLHSCNTLLCKFPYTAFHLLL